MQSCLRIPWVLVVTVCSVLPSLPPAVAGGETAEKAARLILPRLKFEDATVQDVVAFLRQQSKRLDPEKEGINFLLELDSRITAQARGTITMDMRNIPLSEAIRYVCMAAGLQYRIEEYAVIIADRNVPLGEMQTRFYPVKGGVFNSFRTRKRFKRLELGESGSNNGGGNGNGGR